MLGAIPCARANVKYNTRLIDDQISKNVENLTRIRRAIFVGFNNALIFESLGIRGSKMFWFWLHRFADPSYMKEHSSWKRSRVGSL